MKELGSDGRCQLGQIKNGLDITTSEDSERLAELYQLYRGIGTGFEKAPTAVSVRKIANLEAALSEINKRPIGCDGFPYWAYREPIKYARLDPNFLLAYPSANPIQEIHEQLGFNAYPHPVLIKKTRKGREIQIGTVQNRLIERAFARKLTTHLNPFLPPGCCGFRPGISADQIGVQIRSSIRNGNHFAFRTDIKQFFQSINREILALQLADTLKDKELCEMIFEAISPSIGRGEFIRSGLPTGSGLSPVLANLHLYRFDLALSRFHYFRYVDDILVLAQDPEVLLQARTLIESLLHALGLRLNSAKTSDGVCDLHRESVIFLGFEIRGGNLYPSKSSVMKLRARLRIWGQKAWKDPMAAVRSQTAILKCFVKRFHIGPVRKLFRRIDRELARYYPVGISLTSRLDEITLTLTLSTKTGFTRGKAARLTTEKAHKGQVPAVEGSRGVNR